MSKYDLTIAKDMPSEEEAKKHSWWTDYLDARIKAIKACMVLGEPRDLIQMKFRLDYGQCKEIITNIEQGRV